ncbi:MAG: hypothetical protein KDD36_01105 [Flavobacteriales bacterium]|nr:hypothetical protein [Flavobacteriales bacterium]
MKRTLTMAIGTMMFLGLTINAHAQSPGAPGTPVDKKLEKQQGNKPVKKQADQKPQSTPNTPKKEEPAPTSPQDNKPAPQNPNDKKGNPPAPVSPEKKMGGHDHDHKGMQGHHEGHPHGKDKMHGPPDWAPAHGYRRRFVYFPKQEVYYDNEKKVYVQKDPAKPNTWKEIEEVPEKMKNIDLKKEVKVEVEEEVNKIDEIHQDIKKKYPVTYKPSSTAPGNE